MEIQRPSKMFKNLSLADASGATGWRSRVPDIDSKNVLQADDSSC